MKKLLFIIVIFLLKSCHDDVVPKPKAQLRLTYPEAQYKNKTLPLPFSFKINTLSDSVIVKPIRNDKDSKAINIVYPKLKGTIYLTYKPINKDTTQLKQYLIDAQNFTHEHTKIADEIIEQPFENDKTSVYGMFYEVGGNAASQSQFYVTDSVNHFLSGSLYFYAKPNYDSILPAADYLKNDIKKLMETITWQ